MNQHLDTELDAAPARERAAALARLPELLASPTLRILSVATTGLRQAHPVQIVVLDGDGRTLLDTLVHTDQPIEPDAQALHGVQAAQLADAPRLAQVMEDLERLTWYGNDVVAFNPGFTVDALVRACRAQGVEAFGMGHWVDGQALLTPICGVYNWSRGAWGRLSLAQAIGQQPMPGHFAAIGTALGNAQRLAYLLRWHGTPQDAPAEPEAETSGCRECWLHGQPDCGFACYPPSDAHVHEDRA